VYLRGGQVLGKDRQRAGLRGRLQGRNYRSSSPRRHPPSGQEGLSETGKAFLHMGGRKTEVHPVLLTSVTYLCFDILNRPSVTAQSRKVGAT